MSVFKRIISVFLAFSIIISMVTVVPASASGLSSFAVEVDYLPDMVPSWESTFNSWGTSILGSFYEETYYQACWDAIDKCFAGFIGRVNRLSALESRCSAFNNAIKEQWSKSTILYGLASAGKYPVVRVGYVTSLGAYSLVDVNTGLVLVNSVGAYTWYKEVSDPETDTYQNRNDIWLPFSTAISKKQVSVLTKDSLSGLAVTVNQTDRTCSVKDTLINDKEFYVIMDERNNIYANADGVPYVAHYEATVTDQQYNYIVNEGDTVDNSTTIDNSQVIDQSNGVFNYIDTQNNNTEEFFIDELVFDFSKQSYSADTYSIVFDNDKSIYTTNNYLWSVTYNITNTYVTNIGQTELYEPLELYYVLPDGRSSADLTAEEIAGMSFEFADCVNYAKSATDTYLRALYHFDGNTDDSSYFSTQGSFEWLSGASISYMDVGTFDGALYLGPESHSFKITLPSNIGSGDFTLQFRYYQAGAADTQDNRENIVNIEGGSNLQFNWDDSYIYRGSVTDPVAELPLGTWNEFALIRHNGVRMYYLNGILITTATTDIVFGDEITFIFGNTSRAYSMIDELRFVNFAVAEDGASYTPTSVPHDTNSVLVLPDSAFPIADEYWEFKSSRTNILTPYGLDDWTGGNSLSSYFQSVNLNTGTQVGTNGMSPDGYTWKGSQSGSKYAFPYFMYNSKLFSYDAYTEGIVFNRVVPNSLLTGNYSYTTQCSVDSSVTGKPNYYSTTSSCYQFFPTYGIFSPVSCNVNDYQALAGGTYTLSLVSSSGEVSSVTFTVSSYSNLPSSSTSLTTSSVVEAKNSAFGYDFGTMKLWSRDYDTGTHGMTQYLFVAPTSSNPEPIMYMELVSGSSTDLTAEWVNCMYSSEEVKPNTAAIQTDIPINGYTVGGVRPTFPARGDVWMPVSNNRITNVYVYNGSAWEEVNARWYTGTRWIPIYGFDITTLEDCWDIADIDTTVVLIATESQFWSWLQGAWQKMLDKLDAIIIALGGDPNYSPDNPSGSGGTGLWDRIKTAFSDALASIIESLMSFITDVLQLVLDLVYDLLSFFFDFLSTEVVTGIANLFSSFTDGSLLVFFQQEITTTDEEGNEVTTTVIGLPDGVATAFAFFAGVIMILPEELRNLLIFGVGALILIGILKLAKS